MSKYIDAVAAVADEIDDLRAENKRLREALAAIARAVALPMAQSDRLERIRDVLEPALSGGDRGD